MVRLSNTYFPGPTLIIPSIFRIIITYSDDICDKRASWYAFAVNMTYTIQANLASMLDDRLTLFIHFKMFMIYGCIVINGKIKYITEHYGSVICIVNLVAISVPYMC